jgi:DNA-binding LytR/AlgR family response regulator
VSQLTFVIIDDDKTNALKTKAVAEGFQSMTFVGFAANYEDGIDKILETNPDIIFLQINPVNSASNLSLSFINELYRYFIILPKIFITSNSSDNCIECIRYGVANFFVNPVEIKELRKAMAIIEKEFLGRKNIHPDTIGKQIGQSANINTPVATIDTNPIEVQEAETVLEQIQPEIETPIETLITTQEIEIPIEEIAIADEQIVLDVQNNVVSELEEQTEDDFENDIDKVDISDEDSEKEENSKTKDVSFFYENNIKTNELTICIKSYGDYRYIEAKNVCYLQADNNSTDIHLVGGEMITAFKTLKHFEGVLKFPFVRIHNSYIVNTDYVSRIHTGNAVCHIKDTTTKLPFSKSYKENVDALITKIASGNYLEV